MARSRKTQNSQSIPLAPPSTANLPPNIGKPLIDIPAEEQWRLINQSGVLQSSSIESIPAAISSRNMDEVTPLSDEIFNSVLLIIPFSSLLLLMEILIRHQYGKEASLDVIMDRMLPGVPILSIFIFYTTRYKQDRRMQLLLVAISVLVGSRMLWLLNNASWLVNMQQCPPLATVWIYTVVQLDLVAAVVSLLIVGGFVWWNRLKIL